MWAWPLYGAASAAILYSGFRLCKETDALAARWGWTRSWAGLVLLATVTSLPELLTGISSVTVADTPRIALADVAGSLVFNLAILAVLAVVVRRRLFQVANPGHGAAATYATLLAAAATLAVLAAPWLPLAGGGLVLLLFPALYAVAMWDLHRRGLAPATEAAEGGSTLRLLAHALVIVAAAGALPYAGAEIADETGLGRTFVGGLFIAFSTSLPELAVTVAAWRIGAPDLALGNLLGSNLFDVAILGVDEAFYQGPLLANAEPGHLALFGGAVAMSGLAWLGLRLPQRVSGRLVGAAMLAVYGAVQLVAFAQ